MKILLYLLLWIIIGFAVNIYEDVKTYKKDKEFKEKLKVELNYQLTEDDEKIIWREAYVNSSDKVTRETVELDKDYLNSIVEKIGFFTAMLINSIAWPYVIKLMNTKELANNAFYEEKKNELK